MVRRLAAIVSEVVQYWRSPAPPQRDIPYPPLRAMLNDILDEGRRKPLVHMLFQLDVTGVARPPDVSVTAWVAKAFADTVADDKTIQAYRHGRKLVVFEDVDICFMVEREIEGATMPVGYIVRRAQDKDVGAIHEALQRGKDTAGPSKLERAFFDLPRFVRRMVWSVVRRNPNLMKELVGTVGITSTGMLGSVTATGLPITPLTLTLNIGTLESRDGRSILHFNLTIDHDILDGGPLARFADRFQQRIKGSDSFIARN